MFTLLLIKVYNNNSIHVFNDFLFDILMWIQFYKNEHLITIIILSTIQIRICFKHSIDSKNKLSIWLFSNNTIQTRIQNYVGPPPPSPDDLGSVCRSDPDDAYMEVAFCHGRWRIQFSNELWHSTFTQCSGQWPRTVKNDGTDYLNITDYLPYSYLEIPYITISNSLLSKGPTDDVDHSVCDIPWPNKVPSSVL